MTRKKTKKKEEKVEPKMAWSTARRLGTEANVDPRTIRRVLRGEPVKGLAGERAKMVLQAEGLIPVVEGA